MTIAGLVFTAGSEFKGSAKISLKTYYPNNILAEDGMDRIKGDVITSANVDFAVSGDKNGLTLLLTQISTVEYQSIVDGRLPNPKVISEGISLNLQTGTKLANMFNRGKIDKNGASSVHHFKGTQDLQTALVAEFSKVISKGCLSKYFTDSVEGESSSVDSSRGRN